ncbi:MAG: Ig-like domain-containing protein, partial [Anaerovoracaceae bacterium]
IADKSNLTLDIGGDEKVAYTVLPENASNKAIEWQSGNPAIASVSQSGVITAVATGQTFVRANALHDVGVDKIIIVNVTDKKKVKGISIQEQNLVININENSQLTSAFTPADAFNKNVTWSSDNQAIAMVSEAGVVRGVGEGATTIKATSVDSGQVATTTITVKNGVESVSLNKTNFNINLGSSEFLIASVMPETAGDTHVTWSSSDNNIATVTNQGDVRGLAVGSAIITVTTRDGGKTASAIVNVRKPVERISLDKSIETIAIGTNMDIVATVTPVDAINKEVTWSSSDENIALVSATGRVQAISKGLVVITARNTASGVEARAIITVVKKVESITIVNPDIEVITGTSTYLTPQIRPADASNKIIAWTSSDTNVATVDENGLVRGVTGGTA